MHGNLSFSEARCIGIVEPVSNHICMSKPKPASVQSYPSCVDLGQMPSGNSITVKNRKRLRKKIENLMDNTTDIGVM